MTVITQPLPTNRQTTDAQQIMTSRTPHAPNDRHYDHHHKIHNESHTNDPTEINE